MKGITQGRRFRTSTPHAQVEASRRTVVAMDAKARLKHDTRNVNAILSEMFDNVLQMSVPLDRVNDALRCTGFDEIDTVLICGAEGRLHEDVGRNRWLTLTWYRYETGRYEVVAYVN